MPIPPLGLRPRATAEHDRYEEVRAAIARYLDANMAIPQEWFDEQQELYLRLTGGQTPTGEARALIQAATAAVTRVPVDVVLQHNGVTSGTAPDGVRWRAKRAGEPYGDQTTCGYGATKNDALVQLFAKLLPAGTLTYDLPTNF